MLCKYGCGQLGKRQLKSGDFICSNHPSKCPSISNQISKSNLGKLTGRKVSPELAKKRTEHLTGRLVSESTRLRISEGNRKFWNEKTRIPWNKGSKGVCVPWNKGNRKRTPVSAPKDDVFASLQRYRNRVTVRTNRTYDLHKEEINPQNHPRGKCGVDGAWQLDHKISVRQGFEERIPVETMSAKENLQMLPWLDNIRKYDK